MPGVTEDIFLEGGLSTDFAELKATIASVGHRLRRKRMVHVTTPSGTDLRFEVAWKDWNLDDHGICNRPRMITNLPAGKIFTMPREGTMDGRIVLDGSWDASLISDHVVMSVESGRVTRIEGVTSRTSSGRIMKRRLPVSTNDSSPGFGRSRNSASDSTPTHDWLVTSSRMRNA